jgi:hypothetical protein
MAKTAAGQKMSGLPFSGLNALLLRASQNGFLTENKAVGYYVCDQ